MTRISLKEAYDNRDVIAQLVRLRDDVDELLAILKDINPSGDLTNIVTKTGNQTIDGEKTFIGKIIADCDIIQNGSAYETHAEQIFSHNDYMVMRDGQLNGLAPGTFSGLQVKKYNGSDDARMVVDNTGIMRVGDINDEKPLTVRDEAADMISGALVKWDGVNQKIIAPSSNIGSDSAPVKIVNGEPVPITQPFTYQKGQTITLPPYTTAGFGYVNSNGVLQLIIPFPKVVGTGVTVNVSGDTQYYINGTQKNITISGSGNTHPQGIYVAVSGGDASDANKPFVLRAGSAGITITLS